MQNKELVAQIAERTGVSQVVVAKVIESYEDSIMEAVGNGKRVDSRTFGAFLPKNRKAKIGRNPKTGLEVPIPATVKPVFKPSKHFLKVVAKS